MVELKCVFLLKHSIHSLIFNVGSNGATEVDVFFSDNGQIYEKNSLSYSIVGQSILV